jgi:hypothetical protein
LQAAFFVLKSATGNSFRILSSIFVDIFFLLGFCRLLLLLHKPKALLWHVAIAGNYTVEEIIDNNLHDDSTGNNHNNDDSQSKQQSGQERDTDALKRWESFSKSVNSGSLVTEK